MPSRKVFLLLERPVRGTWGRASAYLAIGRSGGKLNTGFASGGARASRKRWVARIPKPVRRAQHPVWLAQWIERRAWPGCWRFESSATQQAWDLSWLAQWIEHRADTSDVGVSSPPPTVNGCVARFSGRPARICPPPPARAGAQSAPPRCAVTAACEGALRCRGPGPSKRRLLPREAHGGMHPPGRRPRSGAPRRRCGA
jgi:hypothetical protein